MKAASPHAWNPRRLDVRAFTEAAAQLNGVTALADLARLSEECPTPANEVAPAKWTVTGEVRQDASGRPTPWLHVEASLEMPVSCQRCLGPVAVPLAVDRWFRFVEDEATAEAEDEDSEEDVLALQPRPDLLTVIEDEFLMSLPLVPMHNTCPEPLAQPQGPVEAGEEVPPRPNPFAVLSKLRQ